MIKGLPEKLQELRAKYGYSQKQVADLIKVSPSVVSGYETGELVFLMELIALFQSILSRLHRPDIPIHQEFLRMEFRLLSRFPDLLQQGHIPSRR